MGHAAAQTHRPWFKVAINTALRAVQPRRARWKWLLYSEMQDGRCVGYGFGWIEHDYTRAT